MVLRCSVHNFKTTWQLKKWIMGKLDFARFECKPWASYQIRKIACCACAGMPGTFSPPPRVSDPDMHHDTCVTHVSWCMPGSLTSGFLWSRWRGNRSRHSRRMRKLQFCVSGKRPIARPPHEPPAILSCTPRLAGYPLDPTQLWHGWLLAD